MGKKGLTLVELLIVIAIIMILVTITAGTLNPGSLVGRGNDARRKKDLGRIKTSFEEYFNDRGCYPNQALVDQLMNQASCGSTTIFPQLKPWPCDPVSRQPYFLVVEADNGCPRWFKVFTKLDYQKDTDIPSGWAGSVHVMGNGVVIYTQDQVNFGTSSTNVSWYDRSVPSYCDSTQCYHRPQLGICAPVAVCSDAEECFTNPSCLDECQVSTCVRAE